MNELEKNSTINDLTNLLGQKRDLYNQMINQEREFEEVKTLFVEIRELEKQLSSMQTEQN